jgi:pimeloyl-ACP methyl ester carboxylesterase
MPHTQGETNGSATWPTSSATLERRADGFLHRRIRAGEVQLHVAEARPRGCDGSVVPADVPLVVFLHGFPEFWWSWRHQLTAMAQAGYWAVAPDMRGYNESDKPEGVSAYEVEKLAGDVAALIRALGRSKAIVVGHDWGAMVAWAFAQEHADMLERLAILNVPHPLVMMRGLRRPSQMRKSWYIFFFQLPRLPERFVAKGDFAELRRMFQADGLSGEETERFIDAMRVPGALPAALNYYRASMRRVLTRRVPRMRPIDKPVLVIWGDKDRVLESRMAEPPKRFVPHARVVHLPDATHWVQNDAPERVNELLLEFIRER